MRVVSWNVDGLGNGLKRRKIKKVLVKVNPDIIMLQETKKIGD